MSPVFSLVIALTILVLVSLHLRIRASARRLGLGSMSESWLAEERAASASSPH